MTYIAFRSAETWQGEFLCGNARGNAKQNKFSRAGGFHGEELYKDICYFIEKRFKWRKKWNTNFSPVMRRFLIRRRDRAKNKKKRKRQTWRRAEYLAREKEKTGESEEKVSSYVCITAERTFFALREGRKGGIQCRCCSLMVIYCKTSAFWASLWNFPFFLPFPHRSSARMFFSLGGFCLFRLKEGRFLLQEKQMSGENGNAKAISNLLFRELSLWRRGKREVVQWNDMPRWWGTAFEICFPLENFFSSPDATLTSIFAAKKHFRDGNTHDSHYQRQKG